jgi:hypothetical protein
VHSFFSRLLALSVKQLRLNLAQVLAAEKAHGDLALHAEEIDHARHACGTVNRQSKEIGAS